MSHLDSKANLSLGLVFLLLFSAAFLVGCRGDLDPQRPDDAYLLFRDALFAGDGQGVWNRSDDQTRKYFEEHYERLVEMNALIERYLPLTDHQLARRQSGVELIERVDSGEALFLQIFTPEQLPDDNAIHFGSTVREIRVSEDGQTAVILTRGEQEFVMMRQDKDEWFVNLAESGDFLDEAFQWLQQNEEALEQTVEDLIAPERQVRETIIADLMGLNDE